MTHDETYQTDKFDNLLAKIDYNQVEGTWDIDMKSQRFDLVAQNYRALRAIVELHKPKYMGCGEDNCCGPDMCECGDTLPCPTIVAIEEQIK